MATRRSLVILVVVGRSVLRHLQETDDALFTPTCDTGTRRLPAAQRPFSPPPRHHAFRPPPPTWATADCLTWSPVNLPTLLTAAPAFYLGAFTPCLRSVRLPRAYLPSVDLANVQQPTPRLPAYTHVLPPPARRFAPTPRNAILHRQVVEPAILTWMPLSRAFASLSCN